jgi:protein O-mannosyl-transferase
MNQKQIGRKSALRPGCKSPGPTPQQRDQSNLPYCILLAMMTFVVYVRTLNNPFIDWDDHGYVVQNLHVQQGITWDSLHWSLTALYAYNWHPLTWLSHAFDCQLFGLNPEGHHLTSIILHVLNTAILFWLLSRVTGRTGRSFVVAALFAVHPLNVESVAWIAERKNVLSMFFFLLTLGAYGWYSLRPSLSRYLTFAGLFALGLAAKPQIVTLPFVLLLLDFWPLQRVLGSSPSPAFPVPQVPFWRLAREKMPLLVLSAASCVITVIAQGSAVQPLEKFPLWTRLLNSVWAYKSYIGKTLWPVRLAVFYPYESDHMSRWGLVGCFMLLAGVSVAVVRWRSRRYLPVGWLWFLGTLVPMIGIIQVSTQAMADRYAYLPLVGIFVMVVWSAADLAHTFGSDVRWLAALAILAFSVLTWRQIGVWGSSAELWDHGQNRDMAEAVHGN